jgi:ABC-type Fe3+/spermidine/putrescine transport system ATPase subunit
MGECDIGSAHSERKKEEIQRRGHKALPQIHLTGFEDSYPKGSSEK